MSLTKQPFDPAAKERELQRESQSWDTSKVQVARKHDIPLIDVSNYFATGAAQDLDSIAYQLRTASTEVGFYSLVGHGVSSQFVNQAFEQERVRGDAVDIVISDNANFFVPW